MDKDEKRLFELFEEVLKDHDWFYQLNDNPFYIKAGESSEAIVKSFYGKCKEIDFNKTEELYNKYKPTAN
jgi:hypothetical protein